MENGSTILVAHLWTSALCIQDVGAQRGLQKAEESPYDMYTRCGAAGRCARDTFIIDTEDGIEMEETMAAAERSDEHTFGYQHSAEPVLGRR
jgi:hypothetical protein